MKYMIHSCDPRLWYVKEYMIPAMLAQGINESEIIIKNDDEHRGCLWAYIDSFWRLKGDGGTWHLQDDVAISRDFAEKTRAHDDGIVYGFFHRHVQENDMIPGKAPAKRCGYSFPCLRIPDPMAREFAEWFLSEAQYRDKYRRWVEADKYVDSFWMIFLNEKYPDEPIFNMKPSIVEHVDLLIGGSTVNKWRDGPCRATYWEDNKTIEELERQLAHRN